MIDWRDVKDYEGYYKVSNTGLVKSMYKNIILKPLNGSSGYLMVNLHINGSQKTRTIHQLVAEAFLGHTRCGYDYVVNHKNGVRTDNRVENLEVTTQRVNTSQIVGASKCVGVGWSKQRSKWTARILIDGSRLFLGYFIEEHDACIAYKDALIKYDLL